MQVKGQGMGPESWEAFRLEAGLWGQRARKCSMLETAILKKTLSEPKTK